MPKMKSHSSSKKRFKLSATGKVKRTKMGKNHILTKKSTKRKRALRKGGYVDDTQSATVKKMLPYA
jgi:large subunit ribosomal protein L35